jgi:hypothetical protein
MDFNSMSRPGVENTSVFLQASAAAQGVKDAATLAFAHTPELQRYVVYGRQFGDVCCTNETGMLFASNMP